MELGFQNVPMNYADGPVAATLEFIGGKWNPLILYQLRDRPMRLSELRRVVPQATQKMLTQQSARRLSTLEIAAVPGRRTSLNQRGLFAGGIPLRR